MVIRFLKKGETRKTASYQPLSLNVLSLQFSTLNSQNFDYINPLFALLENMHCYAFTPIKPNPQTVIPVENL